MNYLRLIFLFGKLILLSFGIDTGSFLDVLLTNISLEFEMACETMMVRGSIKLEDILNGTPTGTLDQQDVQLTVRQVDTDKHYDQWGNRVIKKPYGWRSISGRKGVELIFGFSNYRNDVQYDPDPSQDALRGRIADSLQDGLKEGHVRLSNDRLMRYQHDYMVSMFKHNNVRIPGSKGGTSFNKLNVTEGLLDIIRGPQPPR